MLNFVLIGFFALTMLVFIVAFGGYWRPPKLIEHSRIVKAIRELEDAIAYMEAAPHDFGGHKIAAIVHARLAIEQLRRAILFRVLR